ncbi:MAG: hypothetical protein CMM85_12095 [Rhodothermaceae bacterium]|nr:hypothetical protein [Rhodothermaceae bacterium]
MRLVSVACLALLFASSVCAQEGLKLHAVADGSETLQEVLLDLPLTAIATVGLEEDADGTFAVTVWLESGPAADLARVTTAKAGSVVAVTHGGRVLAMPRIASTVPNGLVTLPGFSQADAEALAASLRGDEAVVPSLPPSEPARPVTHSPPRPWGRSVSQAPPVTPAHEPLAPWERPTLTDEPLDRPPLSASDGPSVAARAFVEAIDGQAWGRAADRLHPDAQAALREDAIGLLRLDGPTVIVRDGLQEGAFAFASVLTGTAPADLGRLSDRDLAALYLAGLDVLGVWGPPGPPVSVVGELADGPVTHVLLRAPDGLNGGTSAVTAVTVRRDVAGAWRVLLTNPQGF